MNLRILKLHNNIILILIAASLAAAPVFAGPLEEANELVNQTKAILEKNLNRSDAPKHYREAYRRFLEKEIFLRRLIARKPDEVGSLLHDALEEVRQEVGLMSHLSFSKLEEGSLGFEAEPVADSTSMRITKTHPWTLAHVHGIRPGDIVESISGVSAAEGLQRDFLEDSLNSPVEVILHGQKKFPLTVLPKGLIEVGDLGFNATWLGDENHQLVTQVYPYSPTSAAGLRRGDRVVGINGTPLVRDRGRRFSTGEAATLDVQRQGENELIRMQVIAGSCVGRGRPFFEEVEDAHQKATYLRVPEFSCNYDPEIIHRGFAHASAHGQPIIIDLRGNSGGRPQHLMAFFLSEGTPFHIQRGQARTEEARIQLQSRLELLNRALQQTHDVDFLNGVLRAIENFGDTFGESSAYRALGELIENRKASFRRLFEELFVERNHTTQLAAATTATAASGAASGASCNSQEMNSALPPLQALAGQIQQAVEQSDELRLARRDALIQQWYDQTARLFSELPAEEPDLIPNDFSHFAGAWLTTPSQKPIPFTGKVAFLVDARSSCAAEICVLAPLEYLKLKGSPAANAGGAYAGPLFPQDILVVGSTQGAAQGLGSETIPRSRFGSFQVSFPLFDVHSPVSGRRIEGTGIHGATVVNHSAAATQALHPAIVQAIRWAHGL